MNILMNNFAYVCTSMRQMPGIGIAAMGMYILQLDRYWQLILQKRLYKFIFILPEYERVFPQTLVKAVYFHWFFYLLIWYKVIFYFIFMFLICSEVEHHLICFLAICILLFSNALPFVLLSDVFIEFSIFLLIWNSSFYIVDNSPLSSFHKYFPQFVVCLSIL